MSEDGEAQGPAKFRAIADTLRGIARQIRYDLCRVDQLHALAAGFDRLADRLEREAPARAGGGGPGTKPPVRGVY